MSTHPIVVEDLSKRYTISAVKRRYDTLQDSVVASVRRVLSQEARGAQDRSFWALKGVSFRVDHGEVVALIGANGAGKSTLLKVLSRITEPTGGHAVIQGRVASLLEVGTGFQPELTGRENIFLSGAILGMRGAEINRKFDEIVEFSGVADFIDTPVKRYSSGMYVRLAFAVAAHLEPEIMFVDEILAVGDAAFQQKCLGKMKDAVTKGRTVLFVSHNMAAVLNLCPRAIWLHGGEIAADGPTDEVVNRYLHSLHELKGQRIADREDRRGNQAMRFVDFELRNAEGEQVGGVQSGEPVTFALRYDSDRDNLSNVYAGIAVHGTYDEKLFEMNTDLNGFRFKSLPREGTLLCTVPIVPLRPGSYSFNVFCSVSDEVADWVLNAGSIDVQPGDFFGSGKLPAADQGTFLVPHTWRLDGEAALSRSCGQVSQ